MSTTTPSSADEPQRAPLPPSPCVGICTLKDDHCYGCGRTSDEIAAWGTLTPVQQSAVWAELPIRLAAFGFKTFRLAAGPAVVGDFIGRTFRDATGRWRLVSPGVEGDMTISADGRPSVEETSALVVAVAANGDRLHLVKHEKVRVFGFSSREDNPQMDTIALVLPKGRAQRDLKELSEQQTSGVRLPLPSPFSEAWLQAVEPGGIDISDQAWPELHADLARLASEDNVRLELRNALGSIETSTPRFADAAPEANAPADLKISRAFAAGAIFHADDPEWLAAALAP